MTKTPVNPGLFISGRFSAMTTCHHVSMHACVHVITFACLHFRKGECWNRGFSLICFCSHLSLSCFLLNAGQKVMPTDIHSTASSSGLEMADALASALWCSTVRFTGSVQHMEETQKKKISHTRFADFRIAHPRRGPARIGQFACFVQGPFASAPDRSGLCSSLVSLAQKVCLSVGMPLSPRGMI